MCLRIYFAIINVVLFFNLSLTTAQRDVTSDLSNSLRSESVQSQISSASLNDVTLKPSSRKALPYKIKISPNPQPSQLASQTLSIDYFTMGKEVVLLDFWASGFGMRARIALSEKGVDYDHQEEDLLNKSELLLKMNPVHKTIPVLVHNGKPVCESLVILQYIDEVWADRAPLLPSDPYHRAQARFWADYIDKKVYDTGKRIWTTKGEEKEKAKTEFIETLKVLEEQAMGEKPFFGGDEFGFLDVALVPYYCWFHSYEVEGNFKVEESCPKFMAWAKRCMQRDSVAKSLPDPHKVYGYMLELKKRFGI